MRSSMRDRMRRTLVACAAVSSLAAAVSAVAAAGDPATTAAIDARDYVAAAGLLRAELAANPGDEPTRFTLARVLGWAGDYPSALAEYDTLIARSPTTSIFARPVLAWQGRDAAALDGCART
jgi:thioredoxin-like negative regulator of GroEL